MRKFIYELNNKFLYNQNLFRMMQILDTKSLYSSFYKIRVNFFGINNIFIFLCFIFRIFEKHNFGKRKNNENRKTFFQRRSQKYKKKININNKIWEI